MVVSSLGNQKFIRNSSQRLRVEEHYMLAYTYPLLSIFWTMLEIFAFVVYFWLLISIYMDIFRNSNMSGGMKALWVLFVFFIPLFGILVYLIVHGGEMHERAAQQAQAQQQAFDNYVKEAAGTSTTDELAKLADLKAKGVLSDAEFETQKAKLLA
jgi:Short C-terminal domain/Phospholipase_D-nuclease N-terminal